MFYNLTTHNYRYFIDFEDDVVINKDGVEVYLTQEDLENMLEDLKKAKEDV